MILCCGNGLFTKLVLTTEIFKGDDVLNIRHKADGIGAVVEATRAHHSNVPHGIANLRHQNAELVQVAEALFGQAQFADSFVELLCSLIRKLQERNREND